MSGGDDNLPPVLPLGTTVVTRVEVKGAADETISPAGAVGVIIRAPRPPRKPREIAAWGVSRRCVPV